jgi:hypothetical protein
VTRVGILCKAIGCSVEPRRYFWDGISKPRSAVGVYQESLASI